MKSIILFYLITLFGGSGKQLLQWEHEGEWIDCVRKDIIKPILCPDVDTSIYLTECY
jgi:hypothetical protein